MRWAPGHSSRDRFMQLAPAPVLVRTGSWILAASWEFLSSSSSSSTWETLISGLELGCPLGRDEQNLDAMRRCFGQCGRAIDAGTESFRGALEIPEIHQPGRNTCSQSTSEYDRAPVGKTGEPSSNITTLKDGHDAPHAPPRQTTGTPWPPSISSKQGPACHAYSCMSYMSWAEAIACTPV